MASAAEIAKFLKNSVEELVKIDEGCCEFKLDDDLSLFVGWSGGYDNQPDDTIIQSKNDPEFAINAGIKSNHEYMKTDFDWLNYPYEEESGEVWDSGITISPNEDYEKDAQWFLDQYAEIRAALDKGEVILESKKVEEAVEEEEISFEEIENMMDSAEDYADLYEAASHIVNTGLRIDVENLIGQCEDDEDPIDQAVSIVTSDLIDMYINDKNVSNLNEGKKVTEGIETEIEDLATVMYSEIMEWATPNRDGKITDFEVNDLEDYQDWYDSSITPEIYNAAKTSVENALNNVKFYEGDRGEPYIELNDNRTLWDIEAPDEYGADEDGSFEVVYSDIVQEACQDFKDETGEELYLLGRMGRHVCVANHYVNAIRYNELKAVQEKYEKQVIDKANAYLKSGLEESKKVTEGEDKLLNNILEYLANHNGSATVRDLADALLTWDENDEMCLDPLLIRLENYEGSKIEIINEPEDVLDIEVKLIEENKKITEGKGDYADALQYAQRLATALKDKGFRVEIGSYEDVINLETIKGNASMGVCVYIGSETSSYEMTENTVGLGGDTVSEETIYPLYAAGWDYETATPSGKQPEVGSVVYAIFKETAKAGINEVVDIIENSFNGTELNESKKLEEKDTKKEFQDYCNDLGLDPNKKSSINKFIKDYAENYVTLKGTKDFTAEIDRIKKELKEGISKKVEDKEEYTLDNIDDAIHEIRSKIAKQRAYDRRRDAVCLSIGDDDAVYKPMYDELKRLNAIKKELQAKK